MPEPRRSQMTIRRMQNAWWVTKATDRHTEFAILIASPPLQWQHERASVLLYTYIACLLLFLKHTCVMYVEKLCEGYDISECEAVQFGRWYRSSCLQVHFQLYAFADQDSQIIKNGRKSIFFFVYLLLQTSSVVPL